MGASLLRKDGMTVEQASFIQKSALLLSFPAQNECGNAGDHHQNTEGAVMPHTAVAGSRHLKHGLIDDGKGDFDLGVFRKGAFKGVAGEQTVAIRGFRFRDAV